MSRKESIALSLLVLAAIILAFVSGFLLDDLVGRPGSKLPILGQAEEILREHGYAPIPDDPALEYGMVRGMIEAYGDPFTTFFEPVQHELQTNDLQGVFGGIGVTLERDPDGRILLYPFPDSPAAAVGVHAGDVLMRVDELEISQMLSFEDVKAAIRGPVNTDVEIEILRDKTENQLVFEITRAEVQLPSVTWRLAPGAPEIGLIEIHLIADRTPEEIERAASDLLDQGAVYFVLDLRGNGGGLLQAGIACARLFLKDGVVIQQQYREQEIITQEVEQPGSLADLQIFLWVNQNTASAAEIFAGALQAHGKILIGTHTYGKDAIQLVFELDDGSSIQVTAAKWWIPGHSFPNDGVGLLPDVPVSGENDALLDATLAAIHAQN